MHEFFELEALTNAHDYQSCVKSQPFIRRIRVASMGGKWMEQKNFNTDYNIHY